MAGPDRYSADRQAARTGEDSGGVIIAAGAGAGDHEHEIGGQRWSAGSGPRALVQAPTEPASPGSAAPAWASATAVRRR